MPAPMSMKVKSRIGATGFDRRHGNILQHIVRNGFAQAIEIIGKLTAGRREKQAVGPAIPGVVPALDQAVLDQPIEQTYQRDRLQLEHLGQIDL